MAELHLYEIIELGYADRLRKDLKKIPKNEAVDLHISSPGGYLFEGVTAYNNLKRTPHEVHVHIDGDCMSAATLIASAGDTVNMASNGLMMIHDPHSPTFAGTIPELRKQLTYLENTKRQALQIYTEKTKQEADLLAQWMTDETYFDAQQAMDAGFVDNVTAPLPIHNRAIEEYRVHDTAKLAKMLAARPVVLSTEELQERSRAVADRLNATLSRLEAIR